jgi:hypothetical protein
LPESLSLSSFGVLGIGRLLGGIAFSLVLKVAAGFHLLSCRRLNVGILFCSFNLDLFLIASGSVRISISLSRMSFCFINP